MVAVIKEHTDVAARGARAPRLTRCTFVDMAELGRNPAKIIPAWQKFMDTEAAGGRPRPWGR